MADGGVAPVAATAAEAAAAAQRLGGVEERFAFARAVSRLYEMQVSERVVSCSARHDWVILSGGRAEGSRLPPAARAVVAVDCWRYG